MTPKRPKALKWIGANLPDGRPEKFIQNVEPRDYDEDETALLTQDQLSSARHSGLYREVPFPESKGKKAKAVKPETEPADTEPAEPEPVADDAAEPAQEGEGA